MRCVFAEWGEEKKRLLNALVGPNQDDFPEVHRHMVSTVLPQTAMPRSRLNRVEALYAQQITIYNQVHNQGSQRTNLLTQFNEMAKKKDTIIDVQTSEMWNVLTYMANVTPISRSVEPAKLRQNGSPLVQKALSYLEHCYKHYMNTVIQKNRLVGLRGGVPNVYNTVCSYVTIAFQSPYSLVGLLDISDGRPLWPHVYYSLRSGDLGAAVQFLKEGGVCPDLLKVLQAKHKQKQDHMYQSNETERPTVKIEGQLKLEYCNKLRVCTDPFKKAVRYTSLYIMTL